MTPGGQVPRGTPAAFPILVERAPSYDPRAAWTSPALRQVARTHRPTVRLPDPSALLAGTPTRISRSNRVGFRDAVIYAAQSTVSITSGNTALTEHVSWAGEVLRIVLRLAGPLLLGLALLAVRNRVITGGAKECGSQAPHLPKRKDSITPFGCPPDNRLAAVHGLGAPGQAATDQGQ